MLKSLRNCLNEKQKKNFDRYENLIFYSATNIILSNIVTTDTSCTSDYLVVSDLLFSLV